jgi:hypothetical protein
MERKSLIIYLSSTEINPDDVMDLAVMLSRDYNSNILNLFILLQKSGLALKIGRKAAVLLTWTWPIRPITKIESKRQIKKRAPCGARFIYITKPLQGCPRA